MYWTERAIIYDNGGNICKKNSSTYEPIRNDLSTGMTLFSFLFFSSLSSIRTSTSSQIGRSSVQFSSAQLRNEFCVDTESSFDSLAWIRSVIRFFDHHQSFVKLCLNWCRSAHKAHIVTIRKYLRIFSVDTIYVLRISCCIHSSQAMPYSKAQNKDIKWLHRSPKKVRREVAKFELEKFIFANEMENRKQ